MKNKKEIEEIINIKCNDIPCEEMPGLIDEIYLLQKEAYLEGQLDEFKDNQIRTNKLLERFGI